MTNTKISDFDQISQGPSLFKNKESFNFDYVPPKLYPRPEARQLFYNLASFVKYKVPDHTLLLGFPGTGKTATINFLTKEELTKYEEIEVKYINCRYFDTTHKVVCYLACLKKAGIPTNEALNIFFKNQTKNILIVFDEIDKLDSLPFQKEKSNLLYYLSRPGEITNNSFKHKIQMVLISNNMSWHKELYANDPATFSSLQLSKIVFSQYNLNDIYQILKLKSQEAVIDSCYDMEALQYIAKLVSDETHGDTRVAIMILKFAVQYLEFNNLDKITPHIIKKVYSQAIMEVEREAIKKLPDSVLKILYSCAITPKEINAANEIYSRIYTPLCREKLKEEPLTYTQFWNHLGYLVSINLITTELEKEGRTRVKKVYLKTSKEVVAAIFEDTIQRGMIT